MKGALDCSGEENSMSRILLVDDNDDIRELYTELLEMLGHAVDSAPDGGTALRVACLRRPDLVVTDLNMPRMNGLELTRRLRDDERFRETPIILHSGSSPLCMRDVTVFLPKPCEIEEFKSTVTRALASSGACQRQAA